MSDEDLRDLERRAATDPAAHVAHRRMLIRLGRAKEAGLELGDVTVFEGHRLKIVKRSEVFAKTFRVHDNKMGLRVASKTAPGRRVKLKCLTHDSKGGSPKWRNWSAKSRTFCDADGWANLDSKRVGTLSDPADPPGEKLPVGRGQHGPPKGKKRIAAMRCAECASTGHTASWHTDWTH